MCILDKHKWKQQCTSTIPAVPFTDAQPHHGDWFLSRTVRIINRNLINKGNLYDTKHSSWTRSHSILETNWAIYIARGIDTISLRNRAYDGRSLRTMWDPTRQPIYFQTVVPTTDTLSYPWQTLVLAPRPSVLLFGSFSETNTLSNAYWYTLL